MHISPGDRLCQFSGRPSDVLRWFCMPEIMVALPTGGRLKHRAQSCFFSRGLLFLKPWLFFRRWWYNHHAASMSCRCIWLIDTLVWRHHPVVDHGRRWMLLRSSASPELRGGFKARQLRCSSFDYRYLLEYNHQLQPKNGEGLFSPMGGSDKQFLDLSFGV